MAAAEQSTWLLRETGNSALEADPRIPPNQKKEKKREIVTMWTQLKQKRLFLRNKTTCTSLKSNSCKNSVIATDSRKLEEIL